MKMQFDVVFVDCAFLPILVDFTGFKIDEIRFLKWKIKIGTKLRMTYDRFIYGVILWLFLVALNFNGA